MAAVLPSGEVALERQVRNRFADEVARLLDTLPGRISAALETPGTKKTGSGRFEVMEAGAVFHQKSGAWLEAAQRKWRDKTREDRGNRTTDFGLLGAGSDDLAGLTLVANDEIERTVAAGRLALAIQDQAGRELSDLRARMQHLEGRADLAASALFRPEVLVKALLDAWSDCGLTGTQWELAQDALSKHLGQGLCEAYARANTFLTEHGVTTDTDLRAKVRRAPDRVTAPGQLPGMGAMPGAPDTFPGNLPPIGSGGAVEGYGLSRNSGAGGAGGLVYVPPGGAGRAGYEAALYGGAGGGVAAGIGAVAAGGLVYAPPGSMARAQYEAALYGGGPDVAAGGPAAAGGLDMAAYGGSAFAAMAVAPLGVRQQQRAQVVLGNLRQFAEQQGVALAVNSGMVQPVSPVLAMALAEPIPASPAETRILSDGSEGSTEEIDHAELSQAAQQLKDKAEALKDKAERPDEKAAIEIVSLMFQAILADERLLPALRVWFGRLQVPVLRVALAEPDFFAAPDHPARRLIDRMGACAMGLDAAEVDGGQLEQEIKRIVQMIEQYPETGKKVFQVALAEFEKFLGGTLAQGKSAQKFATLAQQIEQKDALTIRYTIELRNMLGTISVSEAVRQFLLRVWAEVLALAAVRRGAQDAQTLRFKQAAVDLLWAVSPKADRAERQQVTQYLCGILKTLREGMQTLAMQADEQNEHVHLINQAVAQAFNAPATNGITPMQMNQLAHALIGLEDVVTDDPEGDLLLDPSLLEQMLGVESENLQVIAAGGARPGADMLQWARELQPGQWFTLQYQGAQARVQYIWRSARGQLHLFAAVSGKSYLIQTRRLASYLQAGLIAPVEDEALTVYATRQVLTRLGQEPQRLLD